MRRGSPVDLATDDGGGYTAGAVSIARGLTVAVSCPRCGLDRTDAYPMPDDVDGWVAMVTIVEERLHDAAGDCPGPVACVWQATFEGPR